MRRDSPHYERKRAAALDRLRIDLPAICMACLKLVESPDRRIPQPPVSVERGGRKLDANSVRLIRERQRDGEVFDASDLAIDYGCDREAIRRMLKGETWKSVVV